MSWDEIKYIVKYYLKEPFVELWEARKNILKMRFIINTCLLLTLLAFLINNRIFLGGMIILTIFMHFYNRVQSGDWKHAMREEYKKKTKDEH